MVIEAMTDRLTVLKTCHHGEAKLRMNPTITPIAATKVASRIERRGVVLAAGRTWASAISATYEIRAAEFGRSGRSRSLAVGDGDDQGRDHGESGQDQTDEGRDRVVSPLGLERVQHASPQIAPRETADVRPVVDPRHDEPDDE